jgi:hypothetical protein
VAQLIDPITGQWDDDLIRSLFYIPDVNRILQIPLNNHVFDDFIAWQFTKHGRYAVRSGYHLQWKHQFGPRAHQLSLPGSSANNLVWKSLWKMQIPGKVKFFAWHALHGILPLKSIMVNRHIGTSSQCPICTLAAEDVLHLIFKCPTAQALWDSLGIRGIIEEALNIDRSGSAVLEFKLMKNDNSIPGFSCVGLKETITVGCWYMWWIRHQLTHNESVPPMNHYRMSVLAITTNAARAKRVPCGDQQRWCKPEVRQVKVNVDGSFYQNESVGATGAVIRDYKGKFIAALTTFVPNLASVAEAEALAMREGLCLANCLGCSNVIAESDLLETIQACTGEERWWGESSATYADCVDLSSLIGNVQFKFYQREANGVDHELARFCFSSKNSCNWVDEPPSFLLDKLINDVTEL